MGKRNRRCQSDIPLIVFFLIFICQLLVSCNESQSEGVNSENDIGQLESLNFYGNTQGTTYAVICNDSIDITKAEIENTLHQFDLALSTYIPESIISKLNASGGGYFRYVDSSGFFNNCITISQKVHDLTNGAFDPTVYPLLDAWGFFKDTETIPDSAEVKSLLRLTGFKNYHFRFYFADSSHHVSKVSKVTPQSKLVFNAIAQGQAVDVIAELLESKGAKNYFVEIGGELKVKGLNSEGNLWTIGIDKPIENSNAGNRELMRIITLDNKSAATSGSYRKFYEKGGQKYSHTIDPKTGYPVQHQLLSVTVISESCALADGLATAFMVMGTEKVIDFLDSNPSLEIEVYLIFNNSKNRLDSYMTEGFKTLILE